MCTPQNAKRTEHSEQGLVQSESAPDLTTQIHSTTLTLPSDVCGEMMTPQLAEHSSLVRDEPTPQLLLRENNAAA
jgi:hypothetical protein